MNEPNPEANQSGKVQQLRQFVKEHKQDVIKAAGGGLLAVSVLALPGCNIPAGPPPTPTPITKPTRQPVFEPTAIPKPTPTIEGPTIKGETLAMGGNTLELKTFNGADVAKQIDAQNRGWRIVTNDKGNVQTFLGEANGIQVGVLAQGPEEYTWDSNNSLWRKDNQVNIPNMIIPGAWDEKRQMAGPTVFAEMAFLYKDSQNNYHVGVLYSPQTMQQLPSGVENQIQKLDNGYGLFTGDPKNLTLKDGQSMVRTKEGNLRLINADGTYSQMITSWDKVKTPKQVYQVGSFAGPIESIPSLLYPPESVVGKDYQGEIKLEKEGLVVALNSDANPTQIAVATLNKETNQWVWEKYKTPEVKPPQMAGLRQEVREINGVKRVVYIAEKTNAYGLKEGAYAGEFAPNVYLEKKQTGGLVLTAPVALAELNKQLAQIPNQKDRWLAVLPVDPRTAQSVALSFGKGFDETYEIAIIDFSGKLPLINIIPSTSQLRLSKNTSTGWIYYHPIHLDMKYLYFITPGMEMSYLVVGGSFTGFTANTTIDNRFGTKVTETSGPVVIALAAAKESYPVTREKILAVGGVPVFIGTD